MAKSDHHRGVVTTAAARGLLEPHAASNLLTRWPIRASEARLYIFVTVLLLLAPMRFYSEKIIRSYSASRINLARSATKPSLDMYSSEAFFFFRLRGPLWLFTPRPCLAKA
jgi:hypothetical protein